MRPVVLRRSSGARVSQSLTKCRVTDEAVERAGDGVGILRLDEEPGDISLYDTLVAVDIARHDR
jgi:hypothetical protein